MTNPLESSLFAVCPAPRGHLVVADGSGTLAFDSATVERLGGTGAVVVVVDRKALRQLQREGAEPHRVIVFETHNQLLKLAGGQPVALPDAPQPGDLLAAVERLTRRMGACGLSAVARLEADFAPVLEHLQRAGLPLDLDLWHGLLDAAEGRAAEAREQLAELVGRDLGGAPTLEPGERNKLLDWFRQQGFELHNLTKSTLAGLDHPAARALIVWREASKLTSTYEAYTERAVRGRITGHFTPLGAQSGRMSCGDPNLQNIPAALRAAVVAPAGRRLISADYSGCELRIVADLSGDEAFKSALLAEDFHAAVATRLFGETVSKTERPDLRQAAKGINFGLMYGMGVKRLGLSIGCSADEARRLLDRYFEGFPKLAGWREWAQGAPGRDGYLHTRLGRRLALEPGANPGTLALNFPVQGGGADLIKRAAVRVHRMLAGAPGAGVLINMVHDELLIEADADEADGLARAVAEEMVVAGAELFPSVPMAVEASIAERWEH
jgi:DNA polymerase-1